MSARQKRAVGVLGTLVVVAASLTLSALAILTWAGEVKGASGLGKVFLLTAANGDALSTALKLIPVVATLAAAWVSKRVQADLIYYALVGISVAGMVASVAMIFAISDTDMAKEFWIYSNISGIDSPESFVGPARATLIGALGWFAGVLGIQLGVGGDEKAS